MREKISQQIMDAMQCMGCTHEGLIVTSDGTIIETSPGELEWKAIDITLHHTRGDKNMAARLLGIAIRTIYRRLEKQDNQEHDTDFDDEDTAAPIESDTLKVQ